MNNTILVAIDFSVCSEHALDQAVAIAKKTNSNIVMVWVKTFNDKNFGEDINTLINLGIDSKINELKKKYSIAIGESRLSHTIIEGSRVYDSIAEATKEIDPFLVVIGAHGTTNDPKEIGSNTYRICQTVDRSVIVVNQNSKDRTVKKIVVPIDSTKETHQKLPITALLAKNCGAEIHLLAIYTSKAKHVKDRVDIYVAQSTDYLEKNRIKYIKTDFYTNDISETVIGYAKDNNADLISIMDEQETRALNFWSSSPTQQALNQSPIPILITHMKDTMIILGK